MNAKIKVEKEVEIKYVKVFLPVRYEEEDIPNDFPLRDGDVWRAFIDIDTGEIQSWPNGKSGEMHMKVCDEGSYYLCDILGNDILSIERNYVPNRLIPPTDGYGDYIYFDIDSNGVIKNWYKNPSIEQFLNYED